MDEVVRRFLLAMAEEIGSTDMEAIGEWIERASPEELVRVFEEGQRRPVTQERIDALVP